MVSFATRWLSALRGPPFKSPQRPVTDKHSEQGWGNVCRKAPSQVTLGIRGRKAAFPSGSLSPTAAVSI